MKESTIREQMVATGESLFNRGLTAGSSGNLSARLHDGWLITPTNASLGRLDPAGISKLDSKGNLLSGDPPSKEAFLHLAMYEQRPYDNGIVHLHSTYSAAVSCMAGLPMDDCLPPLTAYFVMKVNRLPLIPYHRPGDSELAEAVRKLAANHHAILLANHGPVVSGVSLETAVLRDGRISRNSQAVSAFDGPKDLALERRADLHAVDGLWGEVDVNRKHYAQIRSELRLDVSRTSFSGAVWGCGCRWF